MYLMRLTELFDLVDGAEGEIGRDRARWGRDAFIVLHLLNT